jgi:peptide-methionine (S)-S-oxide reductase
MQHRHALERVMRSLGPIVLLALTACGSDPTHSGSPPRTTPAGATSAATAPDTLATETEIMPNNDHDSSNPTLATKELATLGAGCFWCVEAVYEQLPGVLGAVSGYMGGTVDNPTYEQVCGKKTGHVEVVQVEFDPRVITYAEVLDWFWRLHDPTSMDRQGADSGPQYRSVIFFHSPEQERIARESLAAAQPSFSKPIVTEIRAASTLWSAEGYHQGFYFDNPSHGYCRAVIAPKLDKLGLKK